MPEIDKIEHNVEKLIEKINGLKYKFSDSSLEEDATKIREEASALLESWLELVNEDIQGRDENEIEED